MIPALIALCIVVINFFFHAPVLARLSDTTYLRRDSESCGYLLQRKEWRALSDNEKRCYIDAVKCLQTRSAQNTSRPASWTRFDEFVGTHADISQSIHHVGQFLPWHRLFLKYYENALRDECGYEGAHPYWDMSIDADLPNLISKSPIWDTVTGFGGDGVPGTYTVPPDPEKMSIILSDSFYHGCVKDGPFADYTLKSGPGLLVTEHCITRGINDTFSPFVNSSTIAYALSFPTFEQFRVKLEGVNPNYGPHGGGHLAIGGDMSNIFTSPGEPLFYLHHTNLDRIWWRWQEAFPERLYAIDGPTSTTPPYGRVTLSYPLKMGSVGPSLPVLDVMDIRKNPSCYTYV